MNCFINNYCNYQYILHKSQNKEYWHTNKWCHYNDSWERQYLFISITNRQKWYKRYRGGEEAKAAQQWHVPVSNISIDTIPSSPSVIFFKGQSMHFQKSLLSCIKLQPFIHQNKSMSLYHYLVYLVSSSVIVEMHTHFARDTLRSCPSLLLPCLPLLPHQLPHGLPHPCHASSPFTSSFPDLTTARSRFMMWRSLTRSSWLLLSSVSSPSKSAWGHSHVRH